ncbi:MAG: methylated-DNA--[protein]-cysteine S-methyltransferase [Sphingopyxis sp.]|nr:methylated-DNA--[protein]-cysteine S-methyltransferase [Sphingopyxis sp.]
MAHVYKTISSPVGELTLVADAGGLAAILWENDRPDRVRLGPLREAADHPVLVETERQLGEYFAGARRSFDVPLSFAGTDFQKSVWAALLTIPFGETRSYGEIASQVGKPSASRAVGAANGRNPISIIAPCHRVIGSGGQLTGFAGGLEAKTFLLDHERQPSLFSRTGSAISAG